jgi:hypothetical protein
LSIKVFTFICLITGIGMWVPLSTQNLFKGKLLSSLDSSAVSSAAIFNKINGSSYTLSNKDGSFTINAKIGDLLEINNIGFENRRFVVSYESLQQETIIILKAKEYRLPEVELLGRSYKKDSLALREEFNKGFDFEVPTVGEIIGGGLVGGGISIDALYQAFQFKRNKRWEKFRFDLEEKEKDNYIKHRFNEEIIQELTGLQGSKLLSFMNIYRPNYYWLTMVGDYDLYEYIKRCSILESTY